MRMHVSVEDSLSLAEPASGQETVPFVSVIMPVLNEERFIGQSLNAVLAQDYPADRFEVVVADGLSTDQTREIVRALQAQHLNVRLIDNPARTVSPGLNRALACARGEIIVRLDGHCEYPADYLRQIVCLREQTRADNVGGVLVPIGESYVQRCVRAAFCSPVGVGGPALKAAPAVAAVREVDAVHGGCWRKKRLVEVGGFDEEMVRNQDDELSFRLRKAGGKVFQHTGIHVRYHVRGSFRKLFLQFAQYGYWKVRVVRKHPQQASLRHFVPGLFLLFLLTLGLLAPFLSGAGWALGALAAGYLATLGSVTLLPECGAISPLWPGTVWALVLMHIGYGGGFLLGWLRQGLGPLPTDKVFERVSR